MAKHFEIVQLPDPAPRDGDKLSSEFQDEIRKERVKPDKSSLPKESEELLGRFEHPAMTACSKFPVLKAAGIRNRIVSGLLTWETEHRGLKDDVEDAALRVLDDYVPEATYGPAQMMKSHFFRLKKEFPKQLGNMQLKDILTDEGAAIICAAYLASNVSRFQNEKLADKERFGTSKKGHLLLNVKEAWTEEKDPEKAVVLSYNPRDGAYTHFMHHDSAQYSQEVLALSGRTMQILYIDLTLRPPQKNKP